MWEMTLLCCSYMKHSFLYDITIVLLLVGSFYSCLAFHDSSTRESLGDVEYEEDGSRKRWIAIVDA